VAKVVSYDQPKKNHARNALLMDDSSVTDLGIESS
jgi:hypothetical protein